MKLMVAGCVDGVSVLALCEKGDQYLLEETSKVFKKEKDMKKGLFLSIHVITLYHQETLD